MNGVIVTEEQVEKALNYLRDSAQRIGELTADARMREHMLKHIKALEMKKSEGPISAQERDALASEAYFKGLNDDAAAASALAVERALREAAAMKIEVWRTQSSNWRSMKI